MENKEIALVYMVAGMSSRFGGKIKQLAKVGPNNTTLMEYSMKQSLPAWFTKIIFIVGEKTREPFMGMFGDNYNWLPVYYAMQTFDPNRRDKPRWTLDALCCATHLIDCPFVVCNWDDLYWANSFKILVENLKKSDDAVTIGYVLENVLSKEWTVNRWVFDIDENCYIVDITETLGIAESNLSELNLTWKELCSMNLFGLSHRSLIQLNEVLENFKNNHIWDRKAECYLPTEFANLIKEWKLKMKIFPTPDIWLGVTHPQDEEIIRKQIEELGSGWIIL
jgi:NDP-sugar pyrophosphorylase family protein